MTKQTVEGEYEVGPDSVLNMLRQLAECENDDDQEVVVTIGGLRKIYRIMQRRGDPFKESG